MHNNPEFNTIGLVSISLTTLNSLFQVFNPILTGLFYIASISWLCVQIYYKLKGKR